MTESYEKYLTALHTEQTIPVEMLNAILGELSSTPVVAKQRIIAGEMNEVYAVTFADGLQVIVRSSSHEVKNFEPEQWAMRACRALGVPAPELLGVWHRLVQGRLLNICVQRKIEGVLLTHANLSQNALHQIVVQAGELLSRIHAIPVKGFGYINGQGEGAFLTLAGETEAMEAEFYELAKRLDLNPHAMSRALQVVIAEERGAQAVESCLTHNDFCAKHIMVANGAVAGIIDFGEVAGSEPLSDFVRWDYYDAARFPLAWLQEGYTNKRVFGGDFRQRLHVKRISFSLWAMRWYAKRGYAEGIADARTKLLQDLAKLA